MIMSNTDKVYLDIILNHKTGETDFNETDTIEDNDTVSDNTLLVGSVTTIGIDIAEDYKLMLQEPLHVDLCVSSANTSIEYKNTLDDKLLLETNAEVGTAEDITITCDTTND